MGDAVASENASDFKKEAMANAIEKANSEIDDARENYAKVYKEADELVKKARKEAEDLLKPAKEKIEEAQQKKYDAVKIKYHQVITDLEDIDNKILYLNFDVNILQQYQTQQSELQNQYYPLVKEIGQIENTIKYGKGL